MDKILETLKNVVANNTGHTFGDLPGRYIVSLPGAVSYTHLTLPTTPYV